MNLIDIIIIALLLSYFVFLFIRASKRRKSGKTSGCCGCCSACKSGCTYKSIK